jgi:hypothetical protein
MIGRQVKHDVSVLQNQPRNTGFPDVRPDELNVARRQVPLNVVQAAAG